MIFKVAGKLYGEHLFALEFETDISLSDFFNLGRYCNQHLASAVQSKINDILKNDISLHRLQDIFSEKEKKFKELEKNFSY